MDNNETTAAAVDAEAVAASIRAATEDVFSTMLGLQSQPGNFTVVRGAPGAMDGVVALIGLAGSWVGTGMISCSAGLAAPAGAARLRAAADDASLAPTG